MSRSGVCRPFDVRRDGFVMGEGAGLLVLEAAEVAERRGAQPLAELVGYGASNDAHHLTNPEPTGCSAALAVRRAIDAAGIEPAEVDYVNAHGTGTLLNDRAETVALKSALGQHAYGTPISSTKSVVGHLVGAAGGIEAVATVGALRRGLIGPTVGYEEPDPELDLDYVPQTLPAGRRNGSVVALSNSFGFGGHNSVLCLRVFPNGASA